MVCPVVGIGASAGGLEALIALFARLPADTGLAFVVVQHLDPHQGSLLSEILARKTTMQVDEASDGTPVEPNRVYVIPPNTTLRIAAGHVALRPRGELPGIAMPVDELFRSLAVDCGSGAIAVVLSGTGSDGALGMQSIKAEGGLTFAQDEGTARFAGMPRAAIELGCVDFILPPPAIADELARVGRHPYLKPDTDAALNESSTDDELSLQRIFRSLRSLSGVDFAQYKRATVMRRLARRLAVHHLQELHEYASLLESTPAETRALYDDLLIRVTRFFRTPQIFDALTHTVFPRMMAQHSPKEPLRIWVPGCSSGEEVYSIAICLVEYLGELSTTSAIRIFGTDLSEAAIETARAGSYVENIVSDVSPERLLRFFIKQDSHYQVAKSIREMCIFARHNVARDPPFSRQDLVSCQNLLIYLEPPLQQRVIPAFHYALKPNGVLILGPAETTGVHSDLFSVIEDAPAKVYVRKSVPGRSHEPMLEDRGPLVERGSYAAPIAPTTDAERVQREVDRLTLERYAPAAVLCDDELNILRFRGDTSPFLAHAAGASSLNLMKLLRPELVVELGPVFREARKLDATVRKNQVRLEVPPGVREINVEVTPVQPSGTARYFLVSFESAAISTTSSGLWRNLRTWLLGSGPPRQDQQGDVEKLTRDLETTRAYIKAIVEEHESAQEELKAAQEELLSSNEEFQSTNEELATSKEELQSANEELATTNEELRHRNRELGMINTERTEARDYADAIVETMREPLVVLDEELRVIRANREFYEFFQTAPQFVEKGLFFELGAREWDVPGLRRLLEEILPASTSFRDCEITATFPRIGSKTLRLNARRLQWSGRALILLAIEDITERQAALNALLDANRRKDEFLAMLAHELRNPLVAIRNGLEIWRRGADAAMQERAQAMVERQLRKEIRLVDDLLDVSRISLGKISLKKDAVDLVQIVKQAVEELRPRLDARRHQLTCSLPDEPVTVEGDATRLEQVVANLLSNSIKFTEPGGTIDVELRCDAKEAVICLRDTGIGIAPELLPAVFDLFVQGDRSLERSEGGLGLGLTLVRRLVKLHGGTIEAHSGGRGQGSKFTVRLPVQPRPSAAVGLPASASPSRGNGRNGRRRILIVDDSADAAESSAMLLRLDEHEIHIAFDGPSALEASRSFKPEIVFLDIGLPGLNGLEVAKRLRQSPEGAGVVLVALSGYGQPEDHRRSLEAGFDRHLVKPVDHAQLDAVIAAYEGKGMDAGGDAG
jgi:two-component system, chemotaxis family, CheB/CheR fusion protein